ncbi:MAG: glycosyltransferase family 39 protein [Candidatus Moranbacteria bacterium]|nr:glycosyltransferase family 39 protein [Candidatus Moranbacteria bacterium]
MKNKTIFTLLIFVAVAVSSLYFGLPRLKDFSGVDEPYWSYDRVPKFWESVSEGKWRSTNICDKPGITLAMISGAGLPFIPDPRDYEDLRQHPKTPAEVEAIRDAYFYLRLPIFLFTLAILPLFYFLIKKLLGKTTARFAVIFIGFSPVLLGISLIINSDAMLWILTALSTLSLFVFFKTDAKKYLVLSGFFLGLSVITKYVANILFVYFFFIFLLEYVLYAHKNIELKKYLPRALVNYLILFATAMMTAFAFFPATWIKFSVLINATVGNAVFASTWPLFLGIIGLLTLDILLLKEKISTPVFNFFIRYKSQLIKTIGGVFLALSLFVFLHVYSNIGIIDLESIIASPKGIGEGDLMERYLGAISADLYSLFFSISPLVLFFLLFSVFGIFRKKELERESVTAIYIILFILVFYLGSAVNEVVTTVRYQIMTYPLAFVLAAIGAKQFIRMEKIKTLVPAYAAYLVFIPLLLLSLFSIKPHFLAYASEILPRDMIVNLKGMGEGSLEAAYYLNTLPGAHEMTIWSDKGAVCEAFVGRCFIDFKNKTFKENQMDYFVVSTDRKSRSLKMSGGQVGYADFKKLYATQNPEFEVLIGGREINFVKVIKAE